MSVKRFQLRTFLIPMTLILVHWLAITLASDVYATGYAWISQWADRFTGSPFPGYPSDEALILGEYPRIAVLYALVLIPLYGLILWLRKREDRQAYWLERLTWTDAWQSMAVMIGMLGVTNLLFSLLTYLSQFQPVIAGVMADYIEQAGAFSATAGYGWLILGVGILAPVCEELLFRGIIQGELRRAIPEWLAVVFQAALFAAFHIQPVQVLYVLLPALALGAAYAVTRSLWVPILMHITFNLLGSVLPAYLGNRTDLTEQVAVTEFAFILVGGMAGIALLLRHRRA